MDVTINRSWGGAEVTVSVEVLRGFHITRDGGGNQLPLPRPTLAAFINCDEIPSRARERFGHSCKHGPPPHSIKVLIFRVHNSAHTYEVLRARAGEAA